VFAALPAVSNQVDHYGDLLPRGAVARLGTLRFVHLGSLASLAISPDGKVVASGVREGKKVILGEMVHDLGDDVHMADSITLTTVRLWDTAKGKVIREIGTPDGPVSSLRFGPAGRTLFAGCGRFVCAWDPATGKKCWQKEGAPGARFHDGVSTEKLVLAGGKLISLHGGILVCSVEKGMGVSYFYHPQVVIRLWDPKTGRGLGAPPALQSSLRGGSHISTLFHAAAVSPNGRFVAVVVSRAEPLPRDKEDPAVRDRWKYTGRRLVLVDMAKGNVCWTLPQGNHVDQGDQPSDEYEVLLDTLVFSPDGSMLALAGGRKVVLFQTATKRKCILAKELAEDPRLAFVGSNQLAAKLEDGTVRAWDIATGKEVRTALVHAQAFVPAQTGRIAATAHGDTVRLTDFRSGRKLHTFEGHRGTPLVRFALYRSAILFSRDREEGRLWDTRRWNQKGVVDLAANRLPDHSHDGPELIDDEVSWEKSLYVRERDNRLELRDINTDRLVRRLEGATEPAKQRAFCASGDRLVVQTKDSFRFFDVGNGKLLSRVPGLNKEVWLLANSSELSPRGTYFARSAEKGRVQLYEVRSGKLLRNLAAKPGLRQNQSVLGFHFSPDERTLFAEVHQVVSFGQRTSRVRSTVTLWDVDNGAILQEIQVHPQTLSFDNEGLIEPNVEAMALAPDGRVLALARKGAKDIELWETASGTRRGALTGHDGPVVSLSFSPDGKHVASGSEDTTILVWDMHRPLRPVRLAGRLTRKELAAHWDILSQPDAEKADQAIWTMVAASGDAIPFLKERLRPARHHGAGRLKRLLEDLDSPYFKRRSAANAEIEGLGELVVGELEKAVWGKNSLEVQRRLETLLRKARAATRPFGTAARLRQWRALEVLERAATPEAVELLRTLASGAPQAVLTKEARAALARVVGEARGSANRR
jgi:WD40 repeat protein